MKIRDGSVKSKNRCDELGTSDTVMSLIYDTYLGGSASLLENLNSDQ